MADAKKPTDDPTPHGAPATAGASKAVVGAVKPDSRPPAPASTTGGVEVRAAPRTEMPADAAPPGKRPPRPWRVPSPPSDTANTPSCNPNFRPPPR
jgi:hypothetical protein